MALRSQAVVMQQQRLSLGMLALLALLAMATAKTLDIHHSHHQHSHHSSVGSAHHRLQRRDMAHGHCAYVQQHFQNMSLKLKESSEEKGAICNGNCCSNATEAELKQKAALTFEHLLREHTKNLRIALETMASRYQDHILELTAQSENKTLNIFSQVYKRMVPLSTQIIKELYSEIIRQLKYSNDYDNSNLISSNSLENLEDAVNKFFVNLFPVAYHQAVHLSKDNNGDMHEDYVSCLKHTFHEIQPFRNIPKDLKHALLHSVQPSTVFINSLLQSAAILGETDGLYSQHLTETCQKQLLKMNHCQSCHGLVSSEVKICYSYCMNVMRGCSSVLSGVLDSPWSNVVHSIDQLVGSNIRSEGGYIDTIKRLDSKLAEAIMVAMENGPELEIKVKKHCGTPKLMPTSSSESENRHIQQSTKWAPGLDMEMSSFHATLDKSKEFYASMVNSVCQYENVHTKDQHCWTGDRLGDYSHMIIANSVDTQRYNPEVPLESSPLANSKLNELVDKLRKINRNLVGAIPSATRSYSDFQNDMARQDEEGSAQIPDDVDDEEYGSEQGSGSGIGPIDDKFDITTTHKTSNQDVEIRSSAPVLSSSICCMIASLLVTFFYAKSRLCSGTNRSTKTVASH